LIAVRAAAILRVDAAQIPALDPEALMGRIVVTEYLSLDGVMEAPGPRDVEDFKYKAWLFDHPRGEEGDRFKLEETLASAALLLGRVTYETFATVWPETTGPMADKFNAMPKYVISSTLTDPGWDNSTVLNGDLVTEVTRLREQVDGDIVVHGSGRLVEALIEHDLVDELRLMVYPVVLGAGRRMFGGTSDKKPLRLVEMKDAGGGGVVLIYTPR
jgi:dihydrofolate reductase